MQALFDAADGRVEEISSRGRKGALAAQRDAALLKTVYAFGLRRREAWRAGLCRPAAQSAGAPVLPSTGRLFVRCGKSSNGSPPKRRTVLTVPEMDWVVPVLEQWVGEVRALFSPGSHPALWVTERRGRLSRRAINEAFEEARAAAGLDPPLDLHCLRHFYITHLIEFGYPERFAQDQAGHSYASTTAIYTGVSDEFRNRLLAAALRERHATCVGRAAVTRKMGIKWHLRLLMAENGLFQTSSARQSNRGPRRSALGVSALLPHARPVVADRLLVHTGIPRSLRATSLGHLLHPGRSPAARPESDCLTGCRSAYSAAQQLVDKLI